MIRLFLVVMLAAFLAPNARAGQSNTPVLALWEFDGWAMPTPERPLGLRFALLEDGRVLFAPDDPAIDALIPNQYFQAQLSPAEMQTLTQSLIALLQPQSNAAPEKQRGWTAFYFRDAATGEQRHAEVSGHPCLAEGRVFSATAPVVGLAAVQNSADRAALPRALREACNLLTGFYHAGAQPWSPQAMPALVPQP